MKLYEYGMTRSMRCHWTLAELEVEYQPVTIDLRKGEHKTAEFLALNPYGKIPVLVDGDAVIAESAAICSYLAEKYPDKHLIPEPGSVERAHYYQWLFFCMAELEPYLWAIQKHTVLYPKARRLPEAIKLAGEEYRDNVKALADRVESNDFILGEAFSVADIVICFNLMWAVSCRLTDAYPSLSLYIERMKQRPAFPHQLYED